MDQLDLDQKINWLLKEKYPNQIVSKSAIKKDILRLENNEPIDYVIGFVDFLDCRIDLSYKPLIPRVETEYWVDLAIKDIKKETKKTIKCLDIFSGSGCIGVTLLKHLSNSKVDFAEKDTKFLKQILKNLKTNQVDNSRSNLIKSDIFSNISGKYDFIFANPPYLASTNLKKIPDSVAKYEPHQALFGGKDGLEIISRFIGEAHKYLLPQGKIFLEFDSWQKAKINQLIKNSKCSHWTFFKDQFHRSRWVVINGN